MTQPQSDSEDHSPSNNSAEPGESHGDRSDQDDRVQENARERQGWPSRLRHALGVRVYRVSGWASPACRDWRWIPTAVAIGTLPLLISVLSGAAGQQLVSAVLLALCCLYFCREDQWVKGSTLITLTFCAHCGLAILLANQMPMRASRVMPDAEDYWQKQVRWIETGKDSEYELKNWVPAHAQMLAGTSLLSFTSFGTITFYEGFHQVDLMNYYNAQLINRSVSGRRSLMMGWHLWSMLRGVGYVFLTFEVISLSLQLLSQIAISTRQNRIIRWSLGLTFVFADCLVKYNMLGYVRNQLFDNLS
ncbi:MAG: hypothetical protein ACI9HK_001480 [Pirellulaceae bacterium]|jgi:hypothetical protein